MRFSLKTLIVLILFCALLGSLTLTARRVAAIQRQEDAVQVMIARDESEIETIKRKLEWQRSEHPNLDLHLQQREALLNRIELIFKAELDGESHIDPKQHSFSIRSIPLIATGADCERKYLIRVPEGAAAFITMDFLIDEQPTR